MQGGLSVETGKYFTSRLMATLPTKPNGASAVASRISKALQK